MPAASAIRFVALLALCGFLAGCDGQAAMREGGPDASPPSWLVGKFVDDYGIQYSISAREWHQQPNARYHVVEWNHDGEYLIARNDADNPADPGLWTRIDWVRLPAMLPWDWAFCLSAYKANTAAEAERTDVARRQTPLSGCNGHPFWRMQRKAPTK